MCGSAHFARKSQLRAHIAGASRCASASACRAASASVLKRTSLELVDGAVQPYRRTGEEALIGEPCERRLARLAKRWDVKPVVATALAGVAFRKRARLKPLPWRNCRAASARSSNARRRSRCSSRCSSWAAINSGSRNLAGLERMADAAGRCLCRAARAASGWSGRRRSKAVDPARAAQSRSSTVATCT